MWVQTRHSAQYAALQYDAKLLAVLYETEDLTGGSEVFCHNEVNYTLNKIYIKFTFS